MTDTAQNVNLQYLRTRLGRICVAIIGSTPHEMLERAAEAVRENTLLEFRLDYLAKPLAAMPRLKEFLHLHREMTAIAILIVLIRYIQYQSSKKQKHLLQDFCIPTSDARISLRMQECSDTTSSFHHTERNLILCCIFCYC